MLKIGLCEDNEIQHNQILSFLETISLPKHTINSFYKGNDLCNSIQEAMKDKEPVSYTHLTLPTNSRV